MRIVVFGATDETGRLVVAGALARGHHVVALSADLTGAGRDLEAHERLELRGGDEDDAVGGADGVVFVAAPSARDGTRAAASTVTAIVRAMKRHGVRRLVCLSSSAVAPRRDGALTALLRRLRGGTVSTAHADDLRRMEVVARQSGLDWTIVRAGRIAGGAPTGSYRVAPGFALDGDPAINRADLAACLVDQIDDREQVGHAVAVGA